MIKQHPTPLRFFGLEKKLNLWKSPNAIFKKNEATDS